MAIKMWFLLNSNKLLERATLRKFFKIVCSYLISGQIPLITAPVATGLNVTAALNVPPNLQTNQVTIPDGGKAKKTAKRAKRPRKPPGQAAMQKKYQQQLLQQQQQQQYLQNQPTGMMYGQAAPQQQQQQAFFQQAPQQRGLPGQPGMQSQQQQRWVGSCTES